VGQEARPLEPSAEPNNTTFVFLPPSGDPNFEDIIDPEQVNTLFGSSTNIIVSQIDTETLAPIISTGSSRVPDIQAVGRPSHQRDTFLRQKPWDTLFSSRIKPPRYSLFGNQTSMDDQEDHNNVRHGEEEEAGNQTETTFGFPILDTTPNVNMKNIPLSALPTFYGKRSEDPDTFLFEFDILCRSYNYLQDAQKLKLFPATLKDSALRWFMGLGESSIRSWEAMKDIFLKKYQDYCKTKESRNDIFKVQQLEDENLEDYMERFAYISQKSKYHDLPDDAVRALFLKGISEEYLEILNLMASGDISHKPFSEICEMCKNYSRSRAKTGKNVRDPYNRNLKPVSSGGITRVEIGNLLENFKTDILSTIGSQLDTLKIKKKQEEENATMSIYCPRCRRKHSSRECPLDNISVCGFCTEDHSTEKCPSLPVC
jgi:hypothetical protein